MGYQQNARGTRSKVGRVSLLEVDGLPVEVTRRARQKNVYLRVKEPDGRVCVSAPLRFPDAAIRSFVRERRAWIAAHQQRIAARQAALGGLTENGAMGRGAAKDGAMGPADAAKEGATGDGSGGLRSSCPSSAPTPEELAEWRAVVAAFVPPLVEKWARVLNVKPGKLAYRNMVSRWGSCNVKTGRICINVQLAAHPPECLEYVVVHELCHLREANHGPRFKALLDACLPQWRAAEAKLKGGIRR